jgi:hypothetical protein
MKIFLCMARPAVATSSGSDCRSALLSDRESSKTLHHIAGEQTIVAAEGRAGVVSRLRDSATSNWCHPSVLSSWITLRRTGTTSRRIMSAELDAALRQPLIQGGVYTFPVAMQYSISAAHTEEDIRDTLACFKSALTGALQDCGGGIRG